MDPSADDDILLVLIERKLAFILFFINDFKVLLVNPACNSQDGHFQATQRLAKD